MTGPVGKVKTAMADLRSGTSTALMVGIAAFLVAVVALIVGLRK
jgi:hypothetical protein